MPASTLNPTPYTDHSVEVDGLKLHYLDYGQAGKPVMLCLHGGQAHGHWYDFVASAFTTTHRVIALEMRGHGDSAWSDPPDYTYERFAADLAEVAEKLDLRDFTLVGHSVGGVVAVLYAAKYPGRLGRLIIMDSTFMTSPDRVAKFREMAMQEGPSYATKEELIARYKTNPPETSASAEVIKYLAGFDARRGKDGRWRQKFDRKFYLHREWKHGFDIWSGIKVPLLLVKASDRVTPKVVDEVKKRCPQLKFVTIENSNHHVMLDQPEAYTRALREFVSGG